MNQFSYLGYPSYQVFITMNRSYHNRSHSSWLKCKRQPMFTIPNHHQSPQKSQKNPITPIFCAMNPDNIPILVSSQGEAAAEAEEAQQVAQERSWIHRIEKETMVISWDLVGKTIVISWGSVGKQWWLHGFFYESMVISWGWIGEDCKRQPFPKGLSGWWSIGIYAGVKRWHRWDVTNTCMQRCGSGTRTSESLLQERVEHPQEEKLDWSRLTDDLTKSWEGLGHIRRVAGAWVCHGD